MNKIIFAGVLYETNESTKYNYLIRVMAKIIINKLLGLAMQYKQIRSFNDAAWDSFEDNGLNEDKLKENFKNLGYTNNKLFDNLLLKYDKENILTKLPDEIVPVYNEIDKFNSLSIQMIDIFKGTKLENIKDSNIRSMIENGTLRLVSERYRNGRLCIYAGEKYDSTLCSNAILNIDEENESKYDLFIKFYKSGILVNVINFDKEYLEQLTNTIEHELAHALDIYNEPNAYKTVIGKNKFVDSKDEYYSRTTEIKAFTNNAKSELEKYINKLLKDRRLNKYMLFDLMKSKESFLSTLTNDYQ